MRRINNSSSGGIARVQQAKQYSKAMRKRRLRQMKSTLSDRSSNDELKGLTPEEIEKKQFDQMVESMKEKTKMLYMPESFLDKVAKFDSFKKNKKNLKFESYMRRRDSIGTSSHRKASRRGKTDNKGSKFDLRGKVGSGGRLSSLGANLGKRGLRRISKDLDSSARMLPSNINSINRQTNQSRHNTSVNNLNATGGPSRLQEINPGQAEGRRSSILGTESDEPPNKEPSANNQQKKGKNKQKSPKHPKSGNKQTVSPRYFDEMTERFEMNTLETETNFNAYTGQSSSIFKNFNDFKNSNVFYSEVDSKYPPYTIRGLKSRLRHNQSAKNLYLDYYTKKHHKAVHSAVQKIESWKKRVGRMPHVLIHQKHKSMVHNKSMEEIDDSLLGLESPTNIDEEFKFNPSFFKIRRPRKRRNTKKTYKSLAGSKKSLGRVKHRAYVKKPSKTKLKQILAAGGAGANNEEAQKDYDEHLMRLYGNRLNTEYDHRDRISRSGRYGFAWFEPRQVDPVLAREGANFVVVENEGWLVGGIGERIMEDIWK